MDLERIHRGQAKELTTTFEWDGLGSGLEPCPVCRNSDSKPAVVAIRPAPRVTKVKRVVYLRCTVCGTIFQQSPVPTSYEVPSGYRPHVDFAVEQGSSIDGMAESLYLLPRSEGARFLEVGCGYGFSLDYAHRVFGYRCTGLDPSPYGLRGAADLGLPILDKYLSREIVESEGPFDLAMCSEVIEHIADPREFLAILHAGLTDSGTVMVTTPNGAMVQRGTEEQRLSSLVSIWHPVLFTRESLELALQEAGFAQVVTWEREATLCGLASKDPSVALDPSKRIDRSAYTRYLRGRWEVSERSSAFARGIGGRLFKELINAGRYEEANRVYGELRLALSQRFGVDIEDGRALPLADSHSEFGDLLPFNIVGILFHRGVYHLNTGDNRGAAENAFLGAFRAGRKLIQVCAENGCYDLELLLFTRLALDHYLACLNGHPRTEALESLRRLSLDFADGLDPYLSPHALTEKIYRLIVDSVMSGNYPEAQVLVEGLGPELTFEGIEGSPASDAAKAELFFSLGVLYMNHLADYRYSLAMFERAAASAFAVPGGARADLAWQAVFHKGLAYRYAGDVGAARTVARLLESNSAEPEGASITPGLLARITELV